MQLFKRFTFSPLFFLWIFLAQQQKTLNKIELCNYNKVLRTQFCCSFPLPRSLAQHVIASPWISLLFRPFKFFSASLFCPPFSWFFKVECYVPFHNVKCFSLTLPAIQMHLEVAWTNSDLRIKIKTSPGAYGNKNLDFIKYCQELSYKKYRLSSFFWSSFHLSGMFTFSYTLQFSKELPWHHVKGAT